MNKPTTTEAHRLALSEALGLGTGAPWDAIRDRATELAAIEPNVDTVANRAAQAISSMGADVRALTQERNRYRNAWHNARSRAADARSDADLAEQQVAALAVPLPPADQTARRARYAEAMQNARCDSSTGPVLAFDRMVEAAIAVADAERAAVLPATTNQTADRAGVYALADRLHRLASSLDHPERRLGAQWAVDALRRMADETAATETEAQQQADVETLARLLSDADVYVNHGDYPGWDDLAESGEQQYRRAARYLLKRLHIAERQPAAGARQDGAQQ